MDKQTKIERFINREELATFLHELADAISNGGSGELDCVDDFKKIKVEAKDEYGQISLKAKVKFSSPCELSQEEIDSADRPTAKPEYSELKKRMRSSFRVIFKMIHNGQMPPQEAVDEFIADSALMVTYEGYGDPYYDEYSAACDEFRKAYETGDMDALNRTIDAIAHQKGHCHARYA